ncbi:MAG: DUF3422 domain-containing protein [Rhodobacter sp.]|nr:DUF3422 domain-containing protein [Rhodobacter sp.]
MRQTQDHPLRYALANELHARPFPALQAPAQAVYLAVKRPSEPAEADLAADVAHLTGLLDRFGAKHPQPGATHYFGDLGPYTLKWERHTEFVTYTVFVPSLEQRPFDKQSFDVFPADWLADLPGQRITSALIRVEHKPDPKDIMDRLGDWFVPESLAASSILDGTAVMAGDFRFDSAGHMRFAVFVRPDAGPRRVGRIVQRICEIETYKAMSMLGLVRVREMSSRLGVIDGQLQALTQAMAEQSAGAEETLGGLLSIASELESISAQTSFRFGATKAYATLVAQRIDVLREDRFEERQSFREFMARRFDPSMRTVQAAEARLESMAARAARTGDLLRTRVDVDRSAQNQVLLASMDRRAALQLRLQKTVEGLSVVAISYYAVNLASYLLYPAAGPLGLSKGTLTAMLTPLVIGAVYLLVRRIRREAE